MSSPIAELLNTPIPEKLWHYTSLQGFQGIISSRKMFATGVGFLNDLDEFVHARKTVDRIIEKTPELDAEGFVNKKFFEKAVTLEKNPLAC